MDNRQQTTDKDNTGQSEWPVVPIICSICHNEPPVDAIRLNCGHIFCYLCTKSASETTGRCALCRAEIGIEFNFQEHGVLGVTRVPTSRSGYYWFYEGFRGWWLYDADTHRDIENAYSTQVTQLEKFIAGYMYVIDLDNMTQQRKDGEGRARKICRATLDLENILGMAGIKGEEFDAIMEMMRSDVQNLAIPLPFS